jgi:hypothetical protein
MIIDRHETHCRSDCRRDGNVNYSRANSCSRFFRAAEGAGFAQRETDGLEAGRDRRIRATPLILILLESAILPARSVLIESARQ